LSAKDEKVVEEAKRAVKGEWEYFVTPNFLKTIKRLIYLAEKYLKQKSKG